MFAKTEDIHLVDECEEQDDRLVHFTVVFDLAVLGKRVPHVGLQQPKDRTAMPNSRRKY